MSSARQSDRNERKSKSIDHTQLKSSYIRTFDHSCILNPNHITTPTLRVKVNGLGKVDALYSRGHG